MAFNTHTSRYWHCTCCVWLGCVHDRGSTVVSSLWIYCCFFLLNPSLHDYERQHCLQKNSLVGVPQTHQPVPPTGSPAGTARDCSCALISKLLQCTLIRSAWISLGQPVSSIHVVDSPLRLVSAAGRPVGHWSSRLCSRVEQ